MSTLPSLSKLTPEQVNRMCAEAMGWRYFDDPCSGGVCWFIGPDNSRLRPKAEFLKLNPTEGRRVFIADEASFPDYATDPASALTLCDALKDDGWGTHLFNIFDKWECEMSPHLAVWRTVVATADTPALAIASAYLLAKNLAAE